MFSANLIAQSAADVRHIEINPESDRLLDGRVPGRAQKCSSLKVLYSPASLEPLAGGWRPRAAILDGIRLQLFRVA
jgi:hypothetical protein